MPTFDNLRYEVTDGRAEILLDRPDVLNAYDDAMLAELDEALDAALDDSSAYVILLSGRGRAFCSGVDLDETADHGRAKREFEEHRARVDSVYRRLHKGRKPTVAAVNGPAIGAGFGFVVSCDLCVVAENAFMRDQHLNVGLTPSVGAGWLLPRKIGAARAKRFILTSEDMTAEAAVETGLAAEVVEPGETMAAARELANRLRDKPSIAMRSALELMNEGQSFEEYVQSASDGQWECRHDDEHAEAVAAVREGRPPEFDRE